MTNYEVLLTGNPIHIATKEVQRRKHPKKRINKKWRKKYGTIEYNSMPHGQVFFNEVDQVFYMTRKTFKELKEKDTDKEDKYSRFNEACKLAKIDCDLH